LINQYRIFRCIGTHVAGIIAANTTGITEEDFTSYIPFIGVAPQVTIGACKMIDIVLLDLFDIFIE